MMKKIILLLFFTSVFFSQTIYTPRDEEICSSKFQLAVKADLFDKPVNEIIIEIAESFIGIDYEANTLEQGDNEQLVVHLTGLDCYTFLESALVFARCIKKNDTTFTCFKRELVNIRYRNGKLKDYPSRLHYFSDWIYDMDKRGIAEDITKKIGGIPYKKGINFMSTHPGSYKRLVDNPHFIDSIKTIEKEISSRNYYYIPQDSVKKYEHNIQSGDILGITTNIEGLDISHSGIAIRLNDNRIHLLHAPSPGKKVQISVKPLAEYIQNVKHQTGIMVLRVLE